MRTKKKDEHIEEGATPISIPTAKTTPIAEKKLTLAICHKTCEVAGTNSRGSAAQSFQVDVGREMEDQTKDPEEKKRIDEEKAILKQFI